jgi:hypothetical protein
MTEPSDDARQTVWRVDESDAVTTNLDGPTLVGFRREGPRDTKPIVDCSNRKCYRRDDGSHCFRGTFIACVSSSRRCHSTWRDRTAFAIRD